MRISIDKQHGEFALSMVNDIVLVDAKGPWNTECVENFGMTYAGTVYKSTMLRWCDIVVLSGESLFVPDAESALRERIGRAISGGLSHVFIVTEKSLTASTTVQQIKNIYAPYNIVVDYLDELEKVFTLAQAAGFNPERERILSFFS